MFLREIKQSFSLSAALGRGSSFMPNCLLVVTMCRAEVFVERREEVFVDEESRRFCGNFKQHFFGELACNEAALPF